MQPTVTVLLPVYNAAPYLRECMDSVLTQTYADFELLVINDGSTDGSEEIILSYTDPRIRYVKNESNLKLIATLNKGIDMAAGKYIARMDSDDVCLPERFEKQVNFMEAHGMVGVCGTWVKTLGLEKDYEVKFRQGHDEIKFQLFFSNYLHHPTVMLRKSVLDHYQIKYGNYLHIEDYEMWVRMSRVCNIEILPQVLLLYRCHGQNISVVNKDFQENYSAQIRKMQMDELQFEYSNEELKAYEEWIAGKTPTDIQWLTTLIGFFNKMVVANRTVKLFKEHIMERYFAIKAVNLIIAGTKFGMPVYHLFKGLQMSKKQIPAGMFGVKLFIKCLLKIQR